VEQLGTEQDVINGVPTYYSWWEMYSTNGAPVPGQGYAAPINSMTISPGDSITARVQYITSGAYKGQFLLSIADASHANDSFQIYETSAQTQYPLTPLRNSAEWIVEDPSSLVRDTPVPDQLANFRTVNFTNATATINGVVGAINSPEWQSTQVNMISNGVVEASTTALINTPGSATSFCVTFALEKTVDTAGLL